MSATHQSTHNGRAGKNGSASHSPARNFTEMIAEQPVTSLAVATAAGFVLGGGARRTGGLTILALLLQVAMREGSAESASIRDLIGAVLGESNEA